MLSRERRNGKSTSSQGYPPTQKTPGARPSQPKRPLRRIPPKKLKRYHWRKPVELHEIPRLRAEGRLTVEPAQSAAPQIALTLVSVEPEEGRGNWKTLWRIMNLNSQPLDLHAVRLPHGQFRSAERRFEPAIALVPKQDAQFQVCVHCDEPAGLVTENAFLIFQVVRRGEQWRIFARVRVTVNSAGTPAAATESITTQQVGFSGVPD